jgi:HEAT repeat protein
MKRTFLLVVAIVSLLASPAGARQWTSRAGGFAVEAELVDVKDGNAILKKADGSQLSVPLKKLSLGDVRYINEELKAAETGITGGKAESPLPTAGSPSSEPQPGAKSAGAISTAIKKLHYAWKQGQVYVYRVRIIGERGNDTENRTGDVTYKVKSTQLDEIQLAMTSKMKYETFVVPHRYVLMPGRHVGFVSDANGAKEVTIRIDPNGRLLESKGEAPLPYLLGDLSELVVEPLPPQEQATWTITGDPGVAVVSLQYPFWRFSMAGFREGVPAAEKTVYTVLDASDKLITLSKHYEMSSAATLAGKPRIEATGDGKLKFDIQRGAFASLDFDIRVTVRDSNKTEETPLHITYRLLSEQAIAEAAKEAQQAKQEAERLRKEKARPLTDKELETALADLASDDAEQIANSAKLLAEKKPQSPNPKVARALESIMLSSENAGHRAEAARALINWSTSENVPSLMKALTSDQWSPVRANAIEALCKQSPKKAILPVAQQLTDPMTRGAATKYLKAAGPDAETAVLPYLDDKDAWVRAEVCGILQMIGTKKSLPGLEKAVAEDNWMVNRPARAAAAAIKARLQLDAAK